MAKRKSSKMEIEFDYEDEPDWESLNVIPMRETSNRKYCSNVWEYFGQLMRATTCLDNKNFYCLPCFQNHKLKQYSSTTATSNFYTHLRVFHNITPERGITRKGTKSASGTSSINTSSSISITTNMQDNEETTQHLNDLMAENPLSEMLIVRPNNNNNNNSTSSICSMDIKKIKLQSPEHQNIDNFIESPIRFKPKSKYLFKKDKTISHQQQIQQNSQQSSQKHYTMDNLSGGGKTLLQIDETINTEDYDKLFILSLVKEFRKVSDDYRLDAKSDLLGVLKKYQHLSRQTNNHNFSFGSERIENPNINTEFETQNIQY